MLEDFLANVPKELVPIIHLSSYFVSDPWVALATGFYLFIKGACLSQDLMMLTRSGERQ